MRKINPFVPLLFILILLISGCSSTFENHGLDNFDPADCSDELTKYLFPNENFLSMFEYVDGNYDYLCLDNPSEGYALAFASLKYVPENYLLAKEYCFDNLNLCKEHQFEYSDFVFHEQICHMIKQDGMLINACRYPQKFNMFAYNDENSVLLFLGYYNWPADADKIVTKESFEDIMSQNFLDFYDFGM